MALVKDNIASKFSVARKHRDEVMWLKFAPGNGDTWFFGNVYIRPEYCENVVSCRGVVFGQLKTDMIELELEVGSPVHFVLAGDFNGRIGGEPDYVQRTTGTTLNSLKTMWLMIHH